MAAESGKHPETTIISPLDLKQVQKEAVRAAFTDWFCRKVEKAEDADLSDHITADEVEFSLLEEGKTSITEEQANLLRTVLLEFGTRTDAAIKGLVARRYEDRYFDAADIVRRYKLGRCAQALAMELVSCEAPPSLLCPELTDVPPPPSTPGPETRDTSSAPRLLPPS